MVERDDVRAGRARPRSTQTVREASAEWLSSRAPKRRKANRSHLEHHILPFMGNKRLPQVTPDLIERFIRHLEAKRTHRLGERNAAGRTLKPATIQNVLITLRKMMNDLGYPTRIKHKVPTKDFSWLKTAADVARFLEACDGGNDDGWFRMAAELAVYAGLRKGEVAGLAWGAIDFERGFVTVERSYDGPTKSKHQRHVPLAPELARSLRRWRLRRGGTFVVVTAAGGRLTEATDMAGRTRRACKRAGVASVKFHELRDTYASHLAERVSLPMVGAALGHADPKTTTRYAHIDTAGLARDARFHLTFAAPDAKVLGLESSADVPRTGHEQRDPTASASQDAETTHRSHSSAG